MSAGLRVARAGWVGLCLLVLGLLAAGLPARFGSLLGQYGGFEQVSGVSPGVVAGTLVTLEVLSVLFHLLVAGVLVRRRPEDPAALFVAYALAANGALIPLQLLYQGVELPPLGELGLQLVLFTGLFTSISLLYLFPDGRFEPGWTRWLAGLWVLVLLPNFVLGETALASLPVWALLGVLLLFAGVGVGAQVYRYRRVSGAVQRQQAKWAILGLTAAVLGPLAYLLPFVIIPQFVAGAAPNMLVQRIGVAFFLTSNFTSFAGLIVVRLAAFLFPLSFAVAILRYRLWDIDILISRTLLYGALTGTIIAVYALVVGGLAAIFQTQLDNVWLILLATVLVAVLAQPLHDRLRQGVNRLIYGDRDEPGRVLNRLSGRLEEAGTGEDALPVIVETIVQSLRTPYAAIALLRLVEGKAEFSPAAEARKGAGSRTDGAEEVRAWPLVRQGELLGRLVVGLRAPGEAFSPGDEELLRNIARQAAEIAYGVRLAEDLRLSRRRLVTALEEERRRLRRDLHDGLGPALAGVILKVDAAAAAVAGSEPQVAGELAGVKGEVQGALLDVRRLVYNLRPPSLDQFGLVGAIDDYLQGANTAAGLRLTLDAPDSLPALPAAVEVAAYRIVLEAVTNVGRHAQASRCLVRLGMEDGGLRLVVWDDGVGFPAGWRAGVGVAAMRERAAELDGEATIGPVEPHGTEVRVWLPVEAFSIPETGSFRDTYGEFPGYEERVR